MRLSRFQLISAIILCLLAGALHAQPAGRYVTSADLYLSTGDWTDIWLNGQQLVDQYPYTSVTKGYVTLRLEKDQLCAFRNENLLALEITETVEQKTLSAENQNDKLGIAYVLEVNYSDGSNLILSSGEGNAHAYFKIKDKADTDPAGWKDMEFNDATWGQAQNSAPPSEISKILTNPKTQKNVQYLSAFDLEKLSQETGDRRLFRRKFSLDVAPGADCPQSRITPTVTPTCTYTPLHRSATMPTPTPQPLPPTLTLTSTPFPIVRKPKATPTLVIRRVKRLSIFTPTPESLVPPEAPTPINGPKARLAVTPRVIPEPTFTREVLPTEAAPETIVFVNPPVNFLVTFKDGPGKYKVEIVNANGSHLDTLYEKNVSGESETWLTWDGKDGEGKPQPYGHYSAVFLKDGKVLRHIALEWISPHL